MLAGLNREAERARRKGRRERKVRCPSMVVAWSIDGFSAAAQFAADYLFAGAINVARAQRELCEKIYRSTLRDRVALFINFFICLSAY